MKTHFPKSILAGLMALLVATPLAAASYADKYSSGTASCSLNTCSVNVRQNAWSYTPDDCTYVSGAVVSCTVYHWCLADFTGVLGTGTVSCYNDHGGSSSDACTLTTNTQCSTGNAFYSTVLARGTCAWFYAQATVASTTGTATATAPAIRICVNSAGPY